MKAMKKAMKVKRVICIVRGHDWLLGRVAERAARALVPGEKSYHNRACTRCTKEEWNADDVEKHADEIRRLRRVLRSSEVQANAEKVNRRSRSPGSDEFP